MRIIDACGRGVYGDTNRYEDGVAARPIETRLRMSADEVEQRLVRCRSSGEEGDLRPGVVCKVEREDRSPGEVGHYAARFQDQRRGGGDVPELAVHRDR